MVQAEAAADSNHVWLQNLHVATLKNHQEDGRVAGTARAKVLCGARRPVVGVLSSTFKSLHRPSPVGFGVDTASTIIKKYSMLGGGLADIDAALLVQRDGLHAMRLVRDAQRATPQCPHLGVRLLEACLLSNQLLCAAHGARTVLRYAMEEEAEEAERANSLLCRFLGSAKAFGARAAKLRFCPAFGEPCVRLTNRSASLLPTAPAPGSVAARDDGQLWSAENLVSWLKATLAREDQWAATQVERHDLAAMRRNLNHATLHHVQGNAEIAAELYRKVIASGSPLASSAPTAASAGVSDGDAGSGPPPTRRDEDGADSAHAGALRAHAHSNLAWLEFGQSKPRARANLEAALRLAPGAAEAAERWLSLATLHWLHSQPQLARHSLRKALALRPGSPFAHALRCELTTLRRDYVEAAAAARRADELQAAATPYLPRCARWVSLLPRLPSLWGEPPAEVGSPRSYRELLLGCSASHRKLTGGGWHDGLERRNRRFDAAAAPRNDNVEPVGEVAVAEEEEEDSGEGRLTLPHADASFDEVHVCDDPTGLAGSGDLLGALASRRRMMMEELWRVLVPGGLLQLRAGGAEANLLPSLVAVAGGSAKQQARFEALSELESAEYVAFQKTKAGENR